MKGTLLNHVPNAISVLYGTQIYFAQMAPLVRVANYPNMQRNTGRKM